MDENAPPVIAAEAEVQPVREIAGFWRRLGAFCVDSVLLCIIGWLSSIPLFNTYVRMGGWGRLVGFAVSLVYFGFSNSRLNKGQSPGKKALGIEVVDASGAYISPGTSAVRYLLLGAPFFLNGLPIPMKSWFSFLGYLDATIVFGLGFANPYLVAFNRGTRQGIHDIVAGTYVVRSGGSGPVLPYPMWRGHLAFIGGGMLMVVGLVCLSPLLLKIPGMADMLALGGKIQLIDMAGPTSVSSNINTSYQNGVAKTVRSLGVTVSWKAKPGSFDQAEREVAAVVVRDYPDLRTKDLLTVTIVYGYDIGIARTSFSESASHSPEDWAAMVSAPP